jgi:spore coat protein SA
MLSGLEQIFPARSGAIEPYVYGLSQELSGKHFVDIFGYGSGKMESKNLRVETFPFESKSFHALERLFGEEYAHGILFNRYVLRKLVNLHKRYSIDLIHIHTVYSVLAAAMAKLGFHIPVICSIHNEIRNALPIKSCDRILANSQFIKDSLSKRGVQPTRINVLPIAVDANKYKSKLNTEHAKKEVGMCDLPIILFVGRKCAEKGPQILIDALPKIIMHTPKIIAILIGPDHSFSSYSETYTRFLQARAKKLHVEENVIFKAFISENALIQFYNAADVFVFPSIWQEPFGKVILEAMSFEKPVVASSVGGVPEIIADGVNGLLVPPKNPDALATSVNYLLDNTKIAKEIGGNGRKTVLEKYCFEKVGERCSEIYEELVH